MEVNLNMSREFTNMDDVYDWFDSIHHNMDEIYSYQESVSNESGSVIVASLTLKGHVDNNKELAWVDLSVA